VHKSKKRTQVCQSIVDNEGESGDASQTDEKQLFVSGINKWLGLCKDRPHDPHSSASINGREQIVHHDEAEK
jgi:hypothetical protein